MSFKSTIFLNKLPSQRFVKQKTKGQFIWFIADKKLKHLKPFANWFKKKEVYFVNGGEKIKNFEKLGLHLEKVLNKFENKNLKNSHCLVLGGGSVLDFAGFLLSIYQRGISHSFIPTSLLACVDSAHGGKTAMNFKKIKNLIGTFYFPKNVFICKEAFKTLKIKHKNEAFAEILKMAFIDKSLLKMILQKKSFDKIVKKSIESKYKIIKKDSLETKGARRVLNLGHSLGHVFESYFQISHGKAIFLGLDFSINYSIYKGYLSQKLGNEYLKLIRPFYSKKSKKIPLKSLKKLLLKDKKCSSHTSLNFIFLNNKTAFSKNTNLKDLIKELKRQDIV